ncbi:MAG TPA: FadR/GntR family transcriptional regulator [Cellulomonas sp.]
MDGTALGPPVPRDRVSDVVAGKLTELIANGTVVPGEVLPNEAELAARFGVGKSAIREAVKIVSTRGLLTVQQGFGTVVNPRDRWNLHDPGVLSAMRTQLTLRQLVEVRRMIEPEAAALAAVRATEADLVRLRELAEPPDESGLVPHDAVKGLTFHEAVADAAHNPAVGILFSTLRVLAQTKLVQDEEPPEPADGQQRPVPRMAVDHRAILAAIVQRDPELARRCAQEHLDGLGPYWGWHSKEAAW